MTILLRLIPYLLGVGAVLAAFWWIYQMGWNARDVEAERERIAAVQRTIEQQQQLDAETLELEFAASVQRERVSVVYRDRVKKVIEYVEVHPTVECLDADGVRLYNELRSGVQGGRGDAGGMPNGTAAAGGWDWRCDSHQPG